jgi:hypothetical protein
MRLSQNVGLPVRVRGDHPGLLATGSASLAQTFGEHKILTGAVAGLLRPGNVWYARGR